MSNPTEKKEMKKYTVKAMYYTYRIITVEAHDEEEAEIRAYGAPCDDSVYMELGKNAILEGYEDVTEVEQ